MNTPSAAAGTRVTSLTATARTNKADSMGPRPATAANTRTSAGSWPARGSSSPTPGITASGARFCHPQGGTWELVKRSDDEELGELAVAQACNCPSGRLVAWRDGEPIEPQCEPSISVTEDPGAGVGGPLWVKGGIRIESEDGTAYETRNRVTLCRCGHFEEQAALRRRPCQHGQQGWG